MSEASELVNKVPEKRRSTNQEPKKSPAGETKAEARKASHGQITFKGNSYDLTGLGALVGGILVLASCLTCGQALYCLPILPLILGIVGLMMSKDAVDAERTRRWSWVGIGGAVIGLLLVAFAILTYFTFIAFVVAVNH